MDILQIVFLGIVATLLYILLRDLNEIFALFIILMTIVLIFALVLNHIASIFSFIEKLAQKSHINDLHLKTILKIIGIAYITEIGSNITEDAGLRSLARKIELAGKIAILLLAIPILTAVIEMILNFFPNF